MFDAVEAASVSSEHPDPASGEADPSSDNTPEEDGPVGADGGVDHGWVMQTTFVVTILTGAPVVAVLSVFVDLPTWPARATFAVRVGAVIWFLTALLVFVFARQRAKAFERERGGPDDDR